MTDEAPPRGPDPGEDPDRMSQIDEQRYRLAQEAARFGIWEWDLERDCIEWDSASWRMLGYEAVQDGTLDYADWRARIHPADLEHIEPIVTRGVAKGEPFTIEFRYRHADGGWLWIQGRGQVTRWTQDGAPAYVMGAHVEVQRLKETEAALRQREQDLAEREAHYRDLVEEHPLLVSCFLPDGTLTFINHTLATFLGTEREQLEGIRWPELLDAAERASAQRHLAAFTPEEPLQRFENHVPDATGERRWVRWTNRAFFNAHGEPTHFQSVGIDITEQREAEQALRKSERRFRQMAESIEEVFLLRAGHELLYISPACERILGYPPEAFSDLSDLLAIVHPEDRERLRASLQEGEARGTPSDITNRIIRPDGEVRWIHGHSYPLYDEYDETPLRAGTLTDVTAYKRLEQQLTYIATHDSLTGVYARGKLEKLLQGAQAAFERHGTPFALLLLDLDHFKQLNDTFGHAFGDQVLQQVTERVAGMLRTEDALGRWGGEEFMVLASLTGFEGALELAERVRATVAGLASPANGVQLSVSVGVVAAEAGASLEALESRVDEALYAAKTAGRDQIAAWRPSAQGPEVTGHDPDS